MISNRGVHNDHVSGIVAAFNLDKISDLVDKLSSLKSQYEYQGFDPKGIFRNLYQKYQSITDKDSIVVVGSETVYKGDKEFMEDMTQLCAIFTMRGANWENIRKKSFKVLVAIMDFFKARYKINNNTEGPRNQNSSRYHYPWEDSCHFSSYHNQFLQCWLW